MNKGTNNKYKIIYVGSDDNKLTYGDTYLIEYSLKNMETTYITLVGFDGVDDVFYLKYFVTPSQYRKMKLNRLCSKLETK